LKKREKSEKEINREIKKLNLKLTLRHISLYLCMLQFLPKTYFANEAKKSRFVNQLSGKKLIFIFIGEIYNRQNVGSPNMCLEKEKVRKTLNQL